MTDARFRAAVDTPPPPDATWIVTGAPWEGVAATGTLWVVYGRDTGGGTHTSLVKPLIYLIGFPGGFTYASVYQGLQAQGQDPATDLLDPWLDAGYDVIIAAYGQYDADGNPIMLPSGMPAGTDYIQRNALMVVAAIQTVIDRRSGDAPLTVVASSMGGLVMRYALRFMENHGHPHQTDTYVSLDSPHRGLNIAVALQWAASHLSLGGELSLFTSPAGQQMLTYCLPPVTQQTIVATPGTLTSPLHDALFHHDPNCSRFPQRVPRLIGISDGSGDGQRIFAPRSIGIEGSGTFGDLALWSLPDASVTPVEIGYSTIPSISPDRYSIAVGGDVLPYDGAPGSQIPMFDLVAGALNGRGITVTASLHSACFVPTISSLAIVGPTSVDMPIPPTGARTPFNYYFVSDQNYAHGQITPAIVTFLMGLLAPA